MPANEAQRITDFELMNGKRYDSETMVKTPNDARTPSATRTLTDIDVSSSYLSFLGRDDRPQKQNKIYLVF